MEKISRARGRQPAVSSGMGAIYISPVRARNPKRLTQKKAYTCLDPEGKRRRLERELEMLMNPDTTAQSHLPISTSKKRTAEDSEATNGVSQGPCKRAKKEGTEETQGTPAVTSTAQATDRKAFDRAPFPSKRLKPNLDNSQTDRKATPSTHAGGSSAPNGENSALRSQHLSDQATQDHSEIFRAGVPGTYSNYAPNWHSSYHPPLQSDPPPYRFPYEMYPPYYPPAHATQCGWFQQGNPVNRTWIPGPSTNPQRIRSHPLPEWYGPPNWSPPLYRHPSHMYHWRDPYVQYCEPFRAGAQWVQAESRWSVSNTDDGITKRE